MSRRRVLIALVVGIVGVNTAFALSDRAATYWGHVSDSIAQSTRPLAEVVASTGIATSRGDWAVHIVLWAVSALAVVLAGRSVRTYLPLGLAFVATGGILELLQNVLTVHRSAQMLDFVGDIVGVCVGTLMGVVTLKLSRVASTRLGHLPVHTPK